MGKETSGGSVHFRVGVGAATSGFGVRGGGTSYTVLSAGSSRSLLRVCGKGAGSAGVTVSPGPAPLTSDLGVDKGVVADFVPDLGDAGEEAVSGEPGVGGQGGHCEAGADIMGQDRHIEAMLLKPCWPCWSGQHCC